MKRSNRKPESVADFKSRIASIMREGEPETIPFRRTPAPIVRIETDRGYYPPSREQRSE